MQKAIMEGISSLHMSLSIRAYTPTRFKSCCDFLPQTEILIAIKYLQLGIISKVFYTYFA